MFLLKIYLLYVIQALWVFSSLLTELPGPSPQHRHTSLHSTFAFYFSMAKGSLLFLGTPFGQSGRWTRTLRDWAVGNSELAWASVTFCFCVFLYVPGTWWITTRPRCLHFLSQRGLSDRVMRPWTSAASRSGCINSCGKQGRGGKWEVTEAKEAQPAAPRSGIAARGRPEETPAAREKQIDSQWLI